MKTIKHIRAFSLGYVCSLFFFVFGIIVGIIAMAGYTNPELRQEMNRSTVQLMSYLGYWTLLIVPIVYAMFGFLSGILISAIYNAFVKFTGGIKVDID